MEPMRVEDMPCRRPASGGLTGLPWPRIEDRPREEGVAAPADGSPRVQRDPHVLPGGGAPDGRGGPYPAYAPGRPARFRPVGAAPRASGRPGALARALAVACLLGVAGACGADAPDGNEGERLTPERFVEVYVELRRAARESPDLVTWEARKAEILRRHGTTAEALEAFADEHAADPAFLAALWDTIRARVEAPDSAASR